MTSLSRQLAMMAYLDTTPASICQLAQHFSAPVRVIRAELEEIFLTEINDSTGAYSPWDLDIPESNDELVTFVGHVQTPMMTLGELMSVLALLDNVLEASDEHTAQYLLALREKLMQAGERAGYASALWAPPVRRIRTDMMDTLVQAKRQRKRVQLEYWVNDGLRAHPKIYDVGIIDICAGSSAYVKADVGDRYLRHFRLDRIGSVEITDTKFSGRDAKSAVKYATERETPFGPVASIIVRPTGRWVAQTAPVEKTTGTDPLTITLRARDFWLATVCIRLGQDLIEARSHSTRAQLAQLLAHYEESQ
ncbi:helix-turn-helix transcriptional regulator [Arcanobacterium canis]